MKVFRKSLLFLVKTFIGFYLIIFVLALRPKKLFVVIKNFKNSKSQIFQDLFCLVELWPEITESSFFVEFGATNGIDLSNTFLFEKYFGMNGILAEPARVWKQALYANRNTNISTRCLWTESNSVLTFVEDVIPDLSRVAFSSTSDFQDKFRSTQHVYTVETISLNDLLVEFDAPKIIDYISVDTEGSEFEILSSFNFRKHRFNFISVEHNFTKNQRKIDALLEENGYKRIHRLVSLWDAWYVPAVKDGASGRD